MKLYQKKPAIVQAQQWLKHGDIADLVQPFYLRTGWTTCATCGQEQAAHGWIESGHYPVVLSQLVCPGDYVVITPENSIDVLDIRTFNKIYDEVK